jgi:maleylacetate reductase
MPQGYAQRYSKLERIYFGRPAAEAVAEEAALSGAARVFVLSNRSLALEASLLGGIVAALGRRCAGSLATLKAQSPSADVLAVVRAAREDKADLLIAVGGGSVMDTAKVALVALVNGYETLAELRTLTSYAQIDQSLWPRDAGLSPLRLVVVPTTLSSAEFNWGASFTDEVAVKKYAVGHPLMAPQAVVLDPRATLTAPDELFLGTGMKAIDHAAERLASLLGNPFSDATAATALTLLNGALRSIKRDRGDLAARLDAQTGTWLSVSGQTSGVPVGASHPIGRILSAFGGVPHGFTTGMILPAVMRWNASANPQRQQRIAAALSAPERTAADAVAALVAELGLPGRLREVGVNPSLFPDLARKTIDESAMRTNPRPIRSEDDIVEILTLAW